MWRSKARAGPPLWTTADQSASISGVVASQSVKSGSGTSKPTWLFGLPRPSAPWQGVQAGANTGAPVRGGAVDPDPGAGEAGTCARSAAADPSSNIVTAKYNPGRRIMEPRISYPS